MTKNKRGGAGRGQGRKPLKVGVKTVVMAVRMLPEQKAKAMALGGGKWVREQIIKAKVCINGK